MLKPAARHLVHLLRHVGEEHRHAEPLGERCLQLLVLERDVDGAVRREVPREHPRHAVLERVARARAERADVEDVLAQRLEEILTRCHRLGRVGLRRPLRDQALDLRRIDVVPDIKPRA